MPYTVEVHKWAEKFLRSLNDAARYRRIRDVVDSLPEDPRAPGTLKLAGNQDIFRLRIAITAFWI